MEDRPDVGLVDAHSERDRGDDDLEPPAEERGLDPIALRGLEPRVIGRRRELGAELGAELLRVLARGRVHDGRAASLLREDVAHRLEALARAHLEHLDGEVRPAEAVNEALPAGEPELLDDVVLNERRRGRGERDDRRGAQHRQPLAEHPVIGPEVVTPLRDAMGLVDRDEHGFAPGEHLGEAGDAQALGGDEEEVEAAGQVVDAGLPGARPIPPRMNALGGEALRLELGHLVLHEGDERAHDERGARAGDAGELIAERFPRAGGHDEEEVVPLGGGAADGLLIRPERAEAKG